MLNTKRAVFTILAIALASPLVTQAAPYVEVSNGERAIIATNSHRPKIVADALEVERGVLWIFFEEGIALVRCCADVCRELPVEIAELRISEVPHLARRP